MGELGVIEWSSSDTEKWLQREGLSDETILTLCGNHRINGKCLLALSEQDFLMEPINQLILSERKCLYIAVKALQRENHNSLVSLGLSELPTVSLYTPNNTYIRHNELSEYCESEFISRPASDDGQCQKLPPEIFKAFLSFCYVVFVTWITAFVMVIVHDRVPDMNKYPPLPDIFLDNVPLIPWAFDMCEITGTILFTIWSMVLFFHKHRFILMRRFFALSGTVFLLRCVTMLITSLSVPGAHLQCRPKNITSQDNVFSDIAVKVSQAYVIWSGAGLSIQGVRTCGDYMFSGHTVALTMLNFFITEYTPRHLYFLHILTWIMNMFGIFFILAAHEHYSIDVFVAFYITSRLFLYYHTLSNNQALVQRDYNRTRVWFPLFSFFESSVDGIVPNEYDTPSGIVQNIWFFIKSKLSVVKQYHVLVNLNLIKDISINNLESCVNGILNDYINKDFLIYINLNEEYGDLRLDIPVIFQNELQDLKYFRMFKATFYVLVISEENLHDVFVFLTYSLSWNPRGKFLVVLDKPFDNIFLIFRKYYVFNILLLIPYDNSVEIVTYFPYKSIQSTTIDICSDGRLMRKNTNLFPDKLPVTWQNISVRTINFVYPPYVIKTKTKEFVGMEVEILSLLQQLMGFNLVYQNKSFQTWGKRLTNGSYVGAYYYLRNYEVDLAYGFFYANRNEHWDFDQTYPYMEDNGKWVVPMAKIEKNWKGVVKIFKVYVWMFIFVTFLCCTFFLVWGTSKGTLLNRITYYFMVSYKCFLGQSVNLPIKNFLRIILGLWVIVGLIFTSAFQGKLISVLNINSREKQISNVEELMTSKIKFGAFVDSKYIFINSNSKYDQYIYDNYEDCPLSNICINRTAFQGDFATFKPKKLVEFMISNTFLDDDGNSLIYMFESNIYNVLVTLAFTKGYPLFDKINRALSDLRSTGFIDLQYRTSSNDYLVYINLSEEYSDVKFKQPVIFQNKLHDLKYFQLFKATYYVLIAPEENLPEIFAFLTYSSNWNPRAKFLVVLDKPFEHIFQIVQKYYIFNILLLIHYNDDIHIITYFPYEENKIEKMDICINGKLSNGIDLFPDKLPKVWHNFTVRTVTVYSPPYVLNFNQDPEVLGMEVNIVSLLQELIGFNVVYEIKPFNNWGIRLKNKSYTGVYSYLKNYEIDLGYGFFFANINEDWDFDQTYPYMEDNVKWIVAMAKIEENWKGVINIFEINIWILIFLTYFCCTFLLVFGSSKGSFLNRTTIYFMESYQCFLGQSVNLPTKTFLRTIFGLWIFFGIIITSTFQGKLISVLNVKSREKQISNVEDLTNSKMTFGFYVNIRNSFLNGSNIDQYIFDHSDTCPLDDLCLNQTAYGTKFATVAPKKIVQYVISQQFLDDAGSSLLYLFDSNINHILITMAFTKGYPMFNKVNRMLSHIRETGFIDFQYKDVLYIAENAIRRAQKTSFGSNPLAMSDLFWIFLILCFGLAIALVTFISEIILYKL
ncbi:hypothetical protein FQR65_LT11402 [Abscondita terminalis]|nr:hypothetical protein FQR65_LT11402 [Abscondita terminalis]